MHLHIVASFAECRQILDIRWICAINYSYYMLVYDFFVYTLSLWWLHCSSTLTLDDICLCSLLCIMLKNNYFHSLLLFSLGMDGLLAIFFLFFSLFVVCVSTWVHVSFFVFFLFSMLTLGMDGLLAIFFLFFSLFLVCASAWVRVLFLSSFFFLC